MNKDLFIVFSSKDKNEMFISSVKELLKKECKEFKSNNYNIEFSSYDVKECVNYIHGKIFTDYNDLKNSEIRNNMVAIVKGSTSEELEEKVNKLLLNFKNIKVVGYGVTTNTSLWYEKEYSCMLIKED